MKLDIPCVSGQDNKDKVVFDLVQVEQGIHGFGIQFGCGLWGFGLVFAMGGGPLPLLGGREGPNVWGF